MRTPVTLISVLLALLFIACGGETEKAKDEGPKTLTPSGRSIVLEDKGFESPESVITDGTYYYVSNVGKELLPSEKDGDGFIMKLNGEGEVVEAKFIEGLDAPKGMVIQEGILYVADVDKVKAFNLSSKEAVGEVDFSSKGTVFLNGMAIKDGRTLFVSATDIGKVFEMDTKNMDFEELVVRPNLIAPNGLYYDHASRKLYVAGYPKSAEGTIGVIHLVDEKNVYSELSPFKGLLDGIALLGQDMIIFSDWNRGVVLLMKIDTKQVGAYPIPVKRIEGPANFLLDDRGELWIPAMRENKIYIQTLPGG